MMNCLIHLMQPCGVAKYVVAHGSFSNIGRPKVWEMMGRTGFLPFGLTFCICREPFIGSDLLLREKGGSADFEGYQTLLRMSYIVLMIVDSR